MRDPIQEKVIGSGKCSQPFYGTDGKDYGLHSDVGRLVVC